MEALTKTDVENLRNYIVKELVPSLRKRRLYLWKHLWHKDNSNRNHFDEIGKKATKLLNLAEDLNRQVTVELLTDIEEPGKEIKTAIHNISDAINKIEEVNQFFAKLAVAVDILETLVSAVRSPNPSAAIRVILNKMTV
jgi:DNA replicative helicase MCM subunit Mcm2 (Cdc46/Mcm family)